jgi:Type III restriction enzyme, res subunit
MGTDSEISALRERLAALDRERAEVARRVSALELPKNPGCTIPTGFAAVNAESPKAHKIALFRRLFKGRLDVFPRRFENAVSGKVGYAPACRNDFVKGICGKPKIKCGQCTNQAFIPVDDAAVLAHLTGTETGRAKKFKDQDFTIGVYPLLPDETCWFVAADFDKTDWLLNATAYRDSAKDLGIPVAIERSRSGMGAHAWIFFEQAVPALDARRLGTLLPRIISCAELFPKHVAVPRGCFKKIQDLLRNLKIDARVRDERFLGAPVNVKFLGALHPDQEPAFKAIKAHDLGVLAVAPSFGKTVLGAKMIAERGVNTLIIVHSKAILNQWLSRLPMFLDISPKDLGVMRGGRKKPTGLIDVALWQSLIRDNVVDDRVANYGQLIVDECHHVAAKKFELIAKEVKARYVLGLSATPVRKDGHHPIIFMQCGPVRYRVSPKELAASRPFEHTIITRHTQFKPIIRDEAQGRVTIQDLYGALARDAARNDLIFDDVVAALDAGFRVNGPT